MVKDCVFSILSRPGLGPSQPHIQWAPEAIYSRLKREEREVDHLPTSAEVKKM
jgi:hypothetical protein